MAFKQPRVPEYRESEGTGRYLHTLVLFLKDFCMDVWTANNQRTGEIDRLKGSIPEMPEIRYPVTSVCGKTGDVTLTAGDVGALEQNGTAVNASKLGGKAPEYYLQPRNLLDNSDFRNLVNQRGINTAVNGLYIIDRWVFYNSNFTGNVTIRQSANGITITNDAGADTVAIVQKFIDKSYYDGKYTAVVKTTDGLVFGYTETIDSENGIAQVSFWLPSGTTAVWAALYEGAYTAETLPPYVPKGYAAEFAECRRYYKRFTAPYAAIFSSGYVTSSTKNVYFNPMDNYPMRIEKPSCSFTGTITVRGINGYIVENYSDAVISVYAETTGCVSSLVIKRGDSSAWNATNNTPVVVTINANSVLELIADL